MVTLPSEAANDYRLVRNLLESGMDLARINCAHDGPEEWIRIVENLHRAERAVGRECRIEMDLAGPKLRTGPVRPGPAVVKLRPTRDALGRATAPARVWLVPLGNVRAATGDGPILPVNGRWLRRRHPDESLELRDARGSRRTLELVKGAGIEFLAEAWKTTYLTPGTRLVARGRDGRNDVSCVGRLHPIEQRIHLSVGERLVLSARADPGEGARLDSHGRVRRRAHISCTLPEGLRYVHAGHSIWLDDGRIGGIVRSASSERLVVEVTHAPEGGTWLAADKGINLPDSALELPPLSPRDLEDLEFATRYADLVGYSFAQAPEDLDRLRIELARLGRPRMGIVVKVENRSAFERLPEILLAGLRRPPVGIMIARGDLAVEVGFDRLAEVQEEVLWLCEAAHLPAIWATQVLEELAKSGQPSRAEVTDAAMGERAECVMLNKGPHIVEAVRALDSILRRMQSHQAKKTAKLRHLHVVERFLADHRRVVGITGRSPSPAASRAAPSPRTIPLAVPVP
jgi:pyruvate kinase